MTTKVDYDAQVKESVTETLDKWLSRGETKLILSMLPAMSSDIQRDCFRTLMLSAIEAGHAAGGATTAMVLFKAMTAKDRLDR